MNSRPRMCQKAGRLLFALLIAWAACPVAFAQAPEVPVYKQGRKESQQDAKMSAEARKVYKSGRAASMEVIQEQLKKRASCRLELSPLSSQKLNSREICIAARQSHLRVGWCYLCRNCGQWHLNLAGGYVLTTNGAVATCYHVAQPRKEMKEGCLVAANDRAEVWPVTEVLAASRYADACILRVEGQDLRPLALNTNVYPGDMAYCFSDPLDHRGYFSQGVVNRFYQFPGRRPFSAAASAAYAPLRLNVSTDWAPGSSGSAVLDECGNAIGHVSTISAVEDQENGSSDNHSTPGPTMIVFHEAVSAADVLRLIKADE